MIIGIIKAHRSNHTLPPITPLGVRALIKNGHDVLIERNCGLESGYHDGFYLAEGAVTINSAKEIHNNSDIMLSQHPAGGTKHRTIFDE